MQHSQTTDAQTRPVQPMVMAIDERLKTVRSCLEKIAAATLQVEETGDHPTEWERLADDALTVANHRAKEALEALADVVGP